MIELGPTLIDYTSEGHPRYITGLPVEGYITSVFGPRDPIWTPVGWTSGFHSGIDIGAFWGTPIYCPAPGKVTFSGMDSVGAHIVTVEFEDGTGASFVHLDQIQAPMGADLDRGALVGFVGSTGMSTAPHLHYMRMRRVVRSSAFWYAEEDLIDPLSVEGGHVAILSVEPAPVIPRDVTLGAWPPAGKPAFVATIADCTPLEIVAEAAFEGCKLESIWAYQNGWQSYIVGAPDVVNINFPALVTAGRGLYVRAAE